MSSLDLSSLIGSQISKVELVEPVSWWFRFQPGGALRADSLWRIVAVGRVMGTSEDHRQQFGLPEPMNMVLRATALLSNRVVTAASCREDTGDVVIEFDTGTRLEVFVTSGGYESWAFFYPNGEEAIGLGGGKVQIIRRDG
jgi:hypothetical protein